MTVKLPEVGRPKLLTYNSLTSLEVNFGGVTNSQSTEDLSSRSTLEGRLSLRGPSSLRKRRVEYHKAISVTEQSTSTVHSTVRQFTAVIASIFKMKSKLKMARKRYKTSWDILTLPGSVFRVVVLGAGGVGKTSLISKFVTDTFPEQYTPTVEDFYEKSVTLNKHFSAFFEILDTAGSYQFPAMKRLTIQHGDAFILVYSVDDQSSLDQAIEIQKEIIQVKGTARVPMVLVGNKTDLVDAETRERTRAYVHELTREQYLLSSETSAKFGVNVSGIFSALLAQIAVVNDKVDTKKRKKPGCVTR